jgi:hypothetical protein
MGPIRLSGTKQCVNQGTVTERARRSSFSNVRSMNADALSLRIASRPKRWGVAE